MRTRTLGRSGIEVGPLALGGNVFGWTIDEAASFEVLDAFVASGHNLIDTADVYSVWVPGHKGGESETIIGNWLKRSGTRDRVVIATKVGIEIAPGEKGLSRTHILRSAERSLNRLQVDVIDLYQAHQDDPGTPLEETLGAFGELVAQGKVRSIGASNYSAARLAEALTVSRERGLPRYESLQPDYNLVDRAGYEAELEPLCAREGLGVIPYYSLAAGFLTGKYRTEADLSKSARGAKVGKSYLNERGLRVLAAVDVGAADLGAKPAQVALAWLMARPSITAPIASATTPAQLDELVAATRLTLSPEAIARLNAAGA
ncbi:MAG TPA: aldo/keto reductase [Gemmataceae bacterium]|jgi:aryl-alcohol dehydrogenase-like predicted oxidoreductase|nr:aldo/keto reductase [Gemmataceae bacterium]